MSFCQDYIEQHTFELLAAVDAGMQFFYDAKQKPDLIIGDFDSVNQEALHYFEAQEGISWLRLIPEKDDTDTEAAVRTIIRAGYTQIHILGGTGCRLDHVLGNIQLLGIGLEADVDILLVDAHNRIRMIKEDISIFRNEQYGHYVSLLPFTPEVTGITLHGMKYPLTDYTMRCYMAIGISNEIVEEEARIQIRDGVLLVLETKD